MAIYDVKVNQLDGTPASLGDYKGKAVLVVNVASFCGLTPQYEGLQKLYDEKGDRGFAVLGFPCNQFLEQEPGTPEEIQEFCTTSYGVTFPIFEKIEVNGDGRHPLYQELTQVADHADGHTGDIRWNFEKFLVDRDGKVLGRYSPTVEPESPELTQAIESALA